MSLIDDVKKSIQEDLTGIKAAADLMKEQQPNTREKDKEIMKDTPTNNESLNDINIDQILEEAPTDDKGNKIIPDNIFDNYYRQLPTGCRNESGTWRTTPTGGKIKIFGGDPEADREIQKKGAETVNAANAHRRSMSEDIQIMLSKKANPETIAALNLDVDANNQQAVIAAAILQAIEGNVKAQQFIRDTIGEQPTAKQDISLQMTDDDKRLLEKVEQRLNG